jgi:hypothetical protein
MLAHTIIIRRMHTVDLHDNIVSYVNLRNYTRVQLVQAVGHNMHTYVRVYVCVYTYCIRVCMRMHACAGHACATGAVDVDPPYIGASFKKA